MTEQSYEVNWMIPLNNQKVNLCSRKQRISMLNSEFENPVSRFLNAQTPHRNALPSGADGPH